MYQEPSDNVIKLWRQDYYHPGVYKTMEELNEARDKASQFFPASSIVYYKDNNGNFVLNIKEPVKDLSTQNTSYRYSNEMWQIKQRAIANGTFMKAPNGKKSNLNERQWLQVRTKAFKKWFGDWIGNPFADSVSLGAGTFNADNADMSGYRPEFPFYVDGEFAGSFHFENLVINRDGENITDDKYLTFPEVGWALELEPEFRGKGYGKAMYYEAAKVAARRGRSLRSASLSNMSEDAKHVWDSLVKNGYARLEDNHYVFNNEKLNYSKVVDENGEPLVVHHYTDNENLSEFSVDFDNYFSQTGGTKKAIFFTEDNVEPGSEDNFLTNRKRKLDVFLNIRDLETHHGTKEDLHRQGTSYREVVNKSSEKPGRTNGLHFSGFDDNQKTDQDIWVIHDPNQVKSATDNIGTFSKEDNDIRYVIEEHKSEHSSDRAKTSAITQQLVDLMKDQGVKIHGRNELIKLLKSKGGRNF